MVSLDNTFAYISLTILNQINSPSLTDHPPYKKHNSHGQRSDYPSFLSAPLFAGVAKQPS